MLKMFNIIIHVCEKKVLSSYEDQKCNEAEGKITKQGNNDMMEQGNKESRRTEGMIQPEPWIIASYGYVKLSKRQF